MSENSLVAGPTDSSWHEGAGIFDSGLNLASEVTSGEWDALALSMGGVAFGLDAIQFAMDPAEELMKAGIGWLLELIPGPLDALERLTGDPNAIEGVAQSWNNVADHLEAVAEDYDTALAKVSDWRGDAAVQYRKVANADVVALRKLAVECRSAASGVTVLGVLVATVRGIIVDLIAEFITDRIEKFLMMLAISAFTFGAANAAFVTESAIKALKLMEFVDEKVKKFFSALAEALDKLGMIGKRVAALAADLKGFIKAGGKLGKAAEIGLTAAKENAAAWREQGDQLSGGSKGDGKTVPDGASGHPTHRRTETGGRISGRIDDGE